ncbi:MAG: DNA (cytosine-5-)-methyltransferase [Fimbriimonadaceae bacterium]|nr:MAG: DNA (cytosine-5-)-methyltransferase [Fimbriimonadaceae bacterium]
MSELKFIDLFCGIGGFHIAMENASEKAGIRSSCVFASDIDIACQEMYEANFGLKPVGDITKIDALDIPDHDVLFAGFPCQPFSIMGSLRGFEDTRGTLFFDIARILKEKRPRAFILENVKQLVGHRQGQTLGRILESLRDLDYYVTYRVLNALDFGLPQKRERVLIVGFDRQCDFIWPQGGYPMKPLKEILETEIPEKYVASEKIQNARSKWHSVDAEPTIWHENKSGNISKYPYSCALRAGASYNYLLVDGLRRLTEREMLRLQGFPDSYKIIKGYSDVRRQAGNSIAVPMVGSVISRVLDSLEISKTKYTYSPGQVEFVYERK